MIALPQEQLQCTPLLQPDTGNTGLDAKGEALDLHLIPAAILAAFYEDSLVTVGTDLAGPVSAGKQQQLIHHPALGMEKVRSAPLCWAGPQGEKPSVAAWRTSAAVIRKGSRTRPRITPKRLEFPGPASLSDLYFTAFCIFKNQGRKLRERQEDNDEEMQKERNQVRERRATSSCRLLDQMKIISDFTEL